MSQPFQPGDVVVVVEGIYNLRPRSVHRVLAVLPPTPGLTSCWGVRVTGADRSWGHANQGWRASRFRKIDDEQIPEVLERLKSLGKRKAFSPSERVGAGRE